jgi:hypothetical protein
LAFDPLAFDPLAFDPLAFGSLAFGSLAFDSLAFGSFEEKDFDLNYSLCLGLGCVVGFGLDKGLCSGLVVFVDLLFEVFGLNLSFASYFVISFF